MPRRLISTTIAVLAMLCTPITSALSDSGGAVMELFGTRGNAEPALSTPHGFQNAIFIFARVKLPNGEYHPDVFPVSEIGNGLSQIVLPNEWRVHNTLMPSTGGCAHVPIVTHFARTPPASPGAVSHVRLTLHPATNGTDCASWTPGEYVFLVSYGDGQYYVDNLVKVTIP